MARDAATGDGGDFPPSLTWLHFGDLHISGTEAQNCRDFEALVRRANESFAGAISFSVLPGDNADNGTDEQFRWIRGVAGRLEMPLHILPGDHDFEPGSLDAFHRVLGAEPLPKVVRFDGYRCLFLDVVSPGNGGPDFRLGELQGAWLETQLVEADTNGETSVVLMHAYPADLREGRETADALFARHRVAVVDTGHTHYNELVNDGDTIFAATRSVGQVEEGPPGFSVMAIDGGVVSWRFHPIDAADPFVLITSPADDRLVTSRTEVVRDTMRIGAMAWGARAISRMTCRIDGGANLELHRSHRQPFRWAAQADTAGLSDGPHRLTVRCVDDTGAEGRDSIAFVIDREGDNRRKSRRTGWDGLGAVGAWPERGLLGTQLGPNKNGRKW